MYFTEPINVRRPHSHRVYMNFMLRRGWHISFLAEDLRTPFPLKLTFAHPDKITEMYERWAEERTLESRAELEHDIETGRGGLWLRLTPEQYAKLKRR